MLFKKKNIISILTPATNTDPNMDCEAPRRRLPDPTNWQMDRECENWREFISWKLGISLPPFCSRQKRDTVEWAIRKKWNIQQFNRTEGETERERKGKKTWYTERRIRRTLVWINRNGNKYKCKNLKTKNKNISISIL